MFNYMLSEIYKNPIFHGIIAGILTGAIMYYIKTKKDKNKKKRSKRVKIDIIPALIISLIVWFASSNYFKPDQIETVSMIQLSPEINVNQELKNRLFEIQTKQSTIDKLDNIPEISSVLFNVGTKSAF